MSKIEINLVVLGPVKSGKSAFLDRIQNPEKKTGYVYDRTVCVSFFSHRFNLRKNEIKIKAWDTTGESQYRAIVADYIKPETQAVFLFCDLSNPNLDELKPFLTIIKSKKFDFQKVVLVASKLVEASSGEISDSKLEKFVSENGLNSYIKIDLSVAGNESGIASALEALVKVAAVVGKEDGVDADLTTVEANREIELLPPKSPFSEILNDLKQYKSTRESAKEGKEYLRYFLGMPCGVSKTKKIAAVDALIKSIDTEVELSLDEFKKHKSALNQGRLGRHYKQYYEILSGRKLSDLSSIKQNP